MRGDSTTPKKVFDFDGTLTSSHTRLTGNLLVTASDQNNHELHYQKGKGHSENRKSGLEAELAKDKNIYIATFNNNPHFIAGWLSEYLGKELEFVREELEHKDGAPKAKTDDGTSTPSDSTAEADVPAQFAIAIFKAQDGSDQHIYISHIKANKNYDASINNNPDPYNDFVASVEHEEGEASQAKLGKNRQLRHLHSIAFNEGDTFEFYDDNRQNCVCATALTFVAKAHIVDYRSEEFKSIVYIPRSAAGVAESKDTEGAAADSGAATGASIAARGLGEAQVQRIKLAQELYNNDIPTLSNEAAQAYSKAIPNKAIIYMGEDNELYIICTHDESTIAMLVKDSNIIRFGSGSKEDFVTKAELIAYAKKNFRAICITDPETNAYHTDAFTDTLLGGPTQMGTFVFRYFKKYDLMLASRHNLEIQDKPGWRSNTIHFGIRDETIWKGYMNILFSSSEQGITAMKKFFYDGLKQRLGEERSQGVNYRIVTQQEAREKMAQHVINELCAATSLGEQFNLKKETDGTVSVWVEETRDPYLLASRYNLNELFLKFYGHKKDGYLNNADLFQTKESAINEIRSAIASYKYHLYCTSDRQHMSHATWRASLGQNESRYYLNGMNILGKTYQIRPTSDSDVKAVYKLLLSNADGGKVRIQIRLSKPKITIEEVDLSELMDNINYQKEMKTLKNVIDQGSSLENIKIAVIHYIKTKMISNTAAVISGAGAAASAACTAGAGAAASAARNDISESRLAAERIKAREVLEGMCQRYNPRLTNIAFNSTCGYRLFRDSASDEIMIEISEDSSPITLNALVGKGGWLNAASHFQNQADARVFILRCIAVRDDLYSSLFPSIT